MLTLRKDITLLVIIAAIFRGLLSPIFSFDLNFRKGFESRADIAII